MSGSYFDPNTQKVIREIRLIGNSPQGEIYEYYRYFSAKKQMFNGKDEVEKLREEPQVDLKYTYLVKEKEAFKYDALLRNPFTYKVPIWTQKQLCETNVSENCNLFGSIQVLNKKDMLAWVMVKNFFWEAGQLWSEDVCGDYFPPFGKPRRGGILQADGTTLIDTNKRFGTSFSEFIIRVRYEKFPTSNMGICGRHTDTNNSLGLFRLAGDQKIYYRAGSMTEAIDPEMYIDIQDGDFISLRLKWNIPIKNAVTFYISYDENESIPGSAWELVSILPFAINQTEDWEIFKYATGSVGTNLFIGDCAYVKFKTELDVQEDFFMEMEVGSLLVGTRGTVFSISGNSIWEKTSEYASTLNTTGFLIVDEANKYKTNSSGTVSYEIGAVIRRDMNDIYNRTFAYTMQVVGGEPAYRKTACQYLGRCQFPALWGGGGWTIPPDERNYLETNETLYLPDCYEVLIILDKAFIPDRSIQYSEFEADFNSSHYVFSNVNHYPQISSLILFKTRRTAFTQPTLNQVLALDYKDWLIVRTAKYQYDFQVGQYLFIWESNEKNECLKIKSIDIINGIIETEENSKYYYTDPLIMPAYECFLIGNPDIKRQKIQDAMSYELNFRILKYFQIWDYFVELSFNSLMFLQPPNYFDEKSHTVEPEIVVNVDGINTTQLYKKVNLSANVFSWGFFRRNYEEIYDLKRFLRYLNGMQREIWMPTLQKDFVPLNSYSDSSLYFDVVNKNLSVIYKDYPNSRAIAIYDGNWYFKSLTDIEVVNENTERVFTDGAIGKAINEKSFICFIIRCSKLGDETIIRYHNKECFSDFSFKENIE